MAARPSVLSALAVASVLACQGHAAAHEPPVGTGVYTQGALLAVRTTRGLVLSQDAERRDFRLLCNEALSVAAYDNPSVIVREDGSLLIGASTGLLRVSADLCSIEPVRAFERVRFSALVPDPQDARHLFAATSIGLYESGDAGETFTLLDASSFDSLEVPRDTRDLVYATGQLPDAQGKPRTYFARWQTGQTLQQSDFALEQSEFGIQLLGSDRSHVFAVAHAYLGTQVLDRFLVSSDDARSWQSPLSAPSIAAFAIEPATGAWLVGSARGLWQLSAAGEGSLQLRSEAVSCLDTAGPHWLMCDAAGTAGGVLQSTDSGAHWSSLLRWNEVRGLAACSEDAPAVQLCQVAWADWQLEMPAVVDTSDAGSVDAAAPDAAAARDAAPPPDAAAASGNELAAQAASGCTVVGGASPTPLLAAWLWLALSLSHARARLLPRRAPGLTLTRGRRSALLARCALGIAHARARYAAMLGRCALGLTRTRARLLASCVTRALCSSAIRCWNRRTSGEKA